MTDVLCFTVCPMQMLCAIDSPSQWNKNRLSVDLSKAIWWKDWEFLSKNPPPAVAVNWRRTAHNNCLATAIHFPCCRIYDVHLVCKSIYPLALCVSSPYYKYVGWHPIENAHQHSNQTKATSQYWNRESQKNRKKKKRKCGARKERSQKFYESQIQRISSEKSIIKSMSMQPAKWMRKLYGDANMTKNVLLANDPTWDVYWNTEETLLKLNTIEMHEKNIINVEPIDRRGPGWSGNWDMHVAKSNSHFQFEFLLLNTTCSMLTAHCTVLEFRESNRKTMEFNYDSIEMWKWCARKFNKIEIVVV